MIALLVVSVSNENSMVVDDALCEIDATWCFLLNLTHVLALGEYEKRTGWGKNRRTKSTCECTPGTVVK